jgi:hypothetical protein
MLSPLLIRLSLPTIAVSGSNFSLGLLSGNIALKRLQLKPDVLAKYEAPADIREGMCGSYIVFAARFVALGSEEAAFIAFRTFSKPSLSMIFLDYPYAHPALLVIGSPLIQGNMFVSVEPTDL